MSANQLQKAQKSMSAKVFASQIALLSYLLFRLSVPTMGKPRLMAENDPEEQQKRVRYTDILANALMVQNVADLTKALETLEQRGYPIKSEDVEHLSAYMTEHLQRFGDYTLKTRPVAPLPNREEMSA